MSGELVSYSSDRRQHVGSPALAALLRELADGVEAQDIVVKAHQIAYEPQSRGVTSPFLERVECSIGNVTIHIWRPLAPGLAPASVPVGA